MVLRFFAITIPKSAGITAQHQNAQASGSSAQCRNLSQAKRKNVVQWAVEPLARASGLYCEPSRFAPLANPSGSDIHFTLFVLCLLKHKRHVPRPGSTLFPECSQYQHDAQVLMLRSDASTLWYCYCKKAENHSFGQYLHSLNKTGLRR